MDHNAEDAWWISTDEFLPDIDERVLVISKFGISNALYTDFGMNRKPTFRPYSYVPGKDVKWWMPIPTDDWHDVKMEQPQDGETVLTMRMFGEIGHGTWKKSYVSDKMEFQPYVGGVLFWRHLPPLPKGVTLKSR